MVYKGCHKFSKLLRYRMLKETCHYQPIYSISQNWQIKQRSIDTWGIEDNFFKNILW